MSSRSSPLSTPEQLLSRALIAAQSDDLATAEMAAEDTLAVAGDDLELRSTARSVLAFVHLRAGDDDAFHLDVEAALRHAEAADSDMARSHAHNVMGIGSYTLGDLVTAVSHYESASRLARAAGQTVAAARRSNNAASALRRLGATGEARRRAQAAADELQAVGANPADALRVLGEVAVDDGDPDAALAILERATAANRGTETDNPMVDRLVNAATCAALAELGEVDRGIAIAEALLAELGARTRWPRAEVEETLASLHAAAGQWQLAYEAQVRAKHADATERDQQQLRRLRDADGEAGRRLLERELREARRNSERDSLTGLPNRRRLERMAPALVAQAALDDELLGAILLDLDHFKAINDQHGHLAGDEVLRRVGRLLSGIVRDHDLLARFGGEEFVVLLPGAAIGTVSELANRMLDELRATDWTSIAPGSTVTASAGVASLRAPASLETLAYVADTRMYAAKRAGRDQVVDADEDDEQTTSA